MTGHFKELIKRLANKKMVFIVFVVFVLIETPAIAVGKEDMAAELLSREEMVRLAGYGEDKLSTVVISGNLLCYAGLDDKKSIYWYPVSGATVSVLCGTSVETKRSWAKGSTNKYGEFLIDLPSHLHAIPNLEKICFVEASHLPESSPCRQAFTGKHVGIELTSVREGVRLYTTNDIYLMSKPSEDHMRHGGKIQHMISELR